MEITCPQCGFARTVPDEKVPERAEIATCPKCKHKFQFRTAGETMPSPPLLADTPPEKPDAHQSPPESVPTESGEASEGDSAQPTARTGHDETASSEKTSPEKSPSGNGDFWDSLASMGSPHQEAQGAEMNAEQPEEVTRNGEVEVPWERLDLYGFFPGIWETIKRAMLRPKAFFQAMPVGDNFLKPLIFFLLIAQFQTVTQIFWQILYPFELNLLLDLETQEPSNPYISFITTPIFATIWIFLWTGFFHFFVLIISGSKNGYIATFKAMVYGNTPWVFIAIPFFIGYPLGIMHYLLFLIFLYSMVISGIGIKYLHKTTSFKAFLVIILPPLVAIFAISFLILNFFSNMLSPVL